MKRSEINAIMRDGIAFIRKMNFALPPFAYFTPAEWRRKSREYDEIRDNMLGWDITDFGSGDFRRVGLFLFTVRNGNAKLRKRYDKPYAEKLMIVEEGQVTPYHFHWSKAEDIINRGGGNLLVQVYNATASDKLAKSPVLVSTDGRNYRVPAGTIVRLGPGESITLRPRVYHQFWGEKRKGRVLVGEVSMVNDDTKDNRFLGKIGRFPAIEEDAAPLHLLCNEYPHG